MQLKTTLYPFSFAVICFFSQAARADGRLIFSGSGAAAASAADSFKTAIKTASGKDSNRIAWDAVKLDGTDANPKTRIISPNKTVEIPVDRFKNVGALFADPYSVSGDGFASVNPKTAGQFPAFSTNNTFVMFDPKDGKFEDRVIEQSFVIPNTDTKAATRGFGVIFIDVELNGSSSIEYFGKNAQGAKISLGKYYVGAGSASGEPQFLGVVFDAPVISEVAITPGSKALFSFNGNTFKSYGAENLPAHIDLVATDDFLFAVPETATTGVAKESPENCLMGWAERNFPPLFSPAGGPTLFAAPYQYRFYRNSGYYLGVSVEDHHVYYMDPKGVIRDAGEFFGWLNTAACQQ